MKYLFFTLFFLCSITTYAQDFYALSTIQTIEITFEQSNWDQLLDAAYANSGDYIMAKSVLINDVEFDSVGVKYKGNSTYNANQIKNPFHIELDTYKEQDYDGYTDIKLSNVAKDPSFLREVLSYQILRQYMDAPLSNYANVYVNGTLIGLYSNSESISKKFVNSRFYSKSNTFVKCNPPEGAGPQSNDFPNLVYLGTDSSNYYAAYELKSDSGWSELIDLCDTLANHVDAIEAILDVDRVLWMLAFNNVLVNLDSYIGAFAQNYYLYRDDNGRFVPVIWDLNESFGRFSMTGTGNLNNTTAKQQMSHLLQLNDNDFPLIKQLLNVPQYRRMYIAHIKTMLLENFDNDSYYSTGLSLQNTIDAAVQADNNKFFSYNNFQTNLTNDINGGPGPGGGGTPGITNLMDGRNTYLLGLSDFNQTEPTIVTPELSSSNPIVNEEINISTVVSNANTVLLGYRNDTKLPFTKVEMYDDGMHNDGAANDGVYAADIVIENTYVQYYVYAENENAGFFSPRRAEHEFHSFTATISNPTVEDLVINEFMASNDVTQADQDGEFDDWIELYNNSSETISLEGYYLSDDADELTKWAFPSGTTITGNGYLVIWADNDEEQDGLHTNFKLSAAAEAVLLIDADGNIVDEVSYIDQITDTSFGRYPNGTGDFQLMSPTFNAENTGTTSTSDIATRNFVLTAFPNPADSYFELVIEGSTSSGKTVMIYDLNGVLLYKKVIDKNLSVDTSLWPAGMYIVKIEDTYLKVIVQ